MLCFCSLLSSLAALKLANDVCTSEWGSFRGIGWVASHEHIILPFSTPQPHALLSADSKVTQAANNKERLGMPHATVWYRTIFW